MSDTIVVIKEKELQVIEVTKPSTSVVVEMGPPGPRGAPGYSPVKGIDYFDGEKGDPGVKGNPGNPGYTPVKDVDYFDGVDGKTAYQVAVDHGFIGTEEDWLNSLKGTDGYTPVKDVDYFDGEKGDKGDKGEQGPQNLFVQDSNPNMTSPGLWIQTGIGEGNDITFWIEDGT